MVLKMKYFNEEKPKNDQLILVKHKEEYEPYLAIYRIFPDGKEGMYLLGDDWYELVKIDSVEPWWFGIPEEFRGWDNLMAFRK